MALTEQQEVKLRTFVEGMALDAEGKDEELKQLVKELFLSKSAKFFEGVTAGTNAVKATMKKTANEEIKAPGEAKSDPKQAKGEPKVKATLKATGDEEITANGEAKSDPKNAKGEPKVKATMKKTADEEIKN